MWTYVGRRWQFLGRHTRPLQGLAAIAAIGGFSFSVYTHFFSSDELVSRNICVSFETYPDNSEFGDNVSLNSIIFQSHHQRGHLFINQSGTTKVLQFMDEGLTIDFPDAANVVEIKLADFHLPIELYVLGVDDKVFETRTVDRENSTELLRLRRETFSITRIKLLGGGNEGGIERVCAQVICDQVGH